MLNVIRLRSQKMNAANGSRIVQPAGHCNDRRARLRLSALQIAPNAMAVRLNAVAHDED
jgi:hypothetical protein